MGISRKSVNSSNMTYLLPVYKKECVFVRSSTTGLLNYPQDILMNKNKKQIATG